MVADGRIPGVDDPQVAQKNIVKAIGKGLLKTISKMGISTTQSYCGAQIFEAVGLGRELIDRHFTGTASRIGGVRVQVVPPENPPPPPPGFSGRPQGLPPVGGV